MIGAKQRYGQGSKEEGMVIAVSGKRKGHHRGCDKLGLKNKWKLPMQIL